jgi:hypothetical protein
MSCGGKPGAYRPAALIASATVTTAATAPEGAAPEAAPAASSTPSPRPRPGLDAVIGLALAVALGALAFTTSGGFDALAASGDTWSEIAVVALGAAACAAVVILGARGKAWGGVTVALFAALTALTALSIAWSVQPENSWQATGQMLAYLATFAGAASMGRLFPQRWPAVVGALATAAVGLSAYGLLVKVFPATLDAGDALGRLQSPFDYWNAAGVAAALGIVPCLWAGARRGQRRILPALAVPGLALLISVVVLSFSRSAVLAALIAVACWFVFVPLRLRSAAVLAVGGVGAAVISGWALATHALTGDRVALAARTAAGHTFGIVIVVTLAVLLVAGLALARASEKTALSSVARRRVGTVLVALVCLLPLAGIGALAASSRGLTGEISHYWHSLTTTHSTVGDNAGRLLQLGNSRPIYWRDGITVGEHALLGGVGAEGYATARGTYATSSLPVSHAHSYVIETFADLGLAGVGLNLALLIAWVLAAARPLAPKVPWRELAPARLAEREGLMVMAIVVVAFGVQSAIDWTWFFSGIAIPILVCAGWLAGRGPLADPVGRAGSRAPILQRPGAMGVVTAVVALALLMAWVTWQPLRSADALSASLNAAASGHSGQAFTDARDAADIDPVSIQPLQILATLYAGAGDIHSARAELVEATQRQPDNPEPWFWLGQFDLAHHQPRLAVADLSRSLHLNRYDSDTVWLAGQAQRELAASG